MSDRRRVDNGLAANVDGYLAGNRHLRSGGRLDVSYRHLYYRETSDRVRPHYKPVIRRRCARWHVYPLADRQLFGTYGPISAIWIVLAVVTGAIGVYILLMLKI